MSVECQYPGHEARRRKRHQITKTSRATCSKEGDPYAIAMEGTMQGQAQKQTHDEQQLMESWLSPSLTEAEKSNSIAGDGRGDWLDINEFLDPMALTKLGDLNDGMDTTHERMSGTSSADRDSLNDFDGLGLEAPWNYPSPVSQEYPFILSFDDCVSNTASATPYPQDQPENRKEDDTIFSPSDRLSSLVSGSQKAGPTSAPQMMTPPSLPAAISSPLQSRSKFDSVKDSCGCLHLATCLLEDLGAESNNSETATMDILLASFRQALSKLADILDCQPCIFLHESNMLLLMAAQYMSIASKRAAMSYLKLNRELEERQQQQSQDQRQSTTATIDTWNSNNTPLIGSTKEETRGFTCSIPRATGEPRGEDMIWFSSYHIEARSERMQVLRCLVTVQLTEFSQLVDKLKGRVGSGIGHLMLLAGAERRIRMTWKMLQAASKDKC
ncbi:hypothetical protein FQN53_009039 [Emmonsiellopsis sp. PD_33]|nr:hypothetical protein FQN53_009039 [Emmonsiellopsis sp. PD_33]KAK2797640.1 hypothetical protein FQN51_008334 [Onygenales sp. PD_10]